jgi:hypothetical protein
MKSFLSKESPKANLEGIKGEWFLNCLCICWEKQKWYYPKLRKRKFWVRNAELFFLFWKNTVRSMATVSPMKPLVSCRITKTFPKTKNNIFNDAMDCILVQKICPNFTVESETRPPSQSSLLLCFVSDTSKAADTEQSDCRCWFRWRKGENNYCMKQRSSRLILNGRWVLNEQTVRFPLSK